MKKIRPAGIAIFLLFSIIATGCTASDITQAKNGDTVQVSYTGKLADGTVFDSSVGQEPLQFTLGSNQIIPGFEKAVLGMKVGDKKTVTIPADEAYGPRLNNLIFEVPRDRLSSDTTPEVGQVLQSSQADGSIIVVTIMEVSDSSVIVDANHPLAGEDLTMDIELMKILPSGAN